MKIYNASRRNIEEALSEVNLYKYGGNLDFRRLDTVTKAGRTHTVVLKVKDSHGPGSRTSASAFNPTRRVASACYHVHGDFFEVLIRLAPDVRIVTNNPVTNTGQPQTVTREGGNWVDNVASPPIVQPPRYFSELCDCKERDEINRHRIAQNAEREIRQANVREYGRRS